MNYLNAPLSLRDISAGVGYQVTKKPSYNDLYEGFLYQNMELLSNPDTH